MWMWSFLNSPSQPSRAMATILAAVISAIVAIVGWFIVNLLNGRREDRTKRLALTIEKTEKQIGEFYAPLLGLLEQLDTVFRVKEQMISQELDNKNVF
jgi:hypothetical protein